MKRVLLILSILISIPLYGERRVLTTIDVVELIIDNNFTVNSIESLKDISEAQYRDALAQKRPQLQFLSDPYTTPLYSYSNYLTDTHTFSGEFNLSQQLPTGGSVSFGVTESLNSNDWETSTSFNLSIYQPLFLSNKIIDGSVANKSRRTFEINYEIATIDELITRNQIIISTLRSINNIMNLRENITLLERRLILLEESLILAKEDRELGRISSADLLSLELSQAKQKEGLLDLQYQLSYAELDLAKVIGIDDVDSVELSFSEIDLNNDLLELEFKKGLDEERSSLERELIQLQEELSTPLDNPNVNMFINTNREGNISLGIGFNMKLYDGGSKRYRESIEDITLEMANKSLIESRKEGLNRFRTLNAQLQLLQEKQELLKRNMQYDSLLLERERDLYEIGSSTSSDILLVELDLLNRESELKSIQRENSLIKLEILHNIGRDLLQLIR